MTGGPPSNDEEEVRVLVAAPSMTFDAVAAASTALLAPRVDREDGAWILQPRGRHTFRLPHPTLGFELAPGLFSLVEASGPLVWRVRSTPQLSYATFTNAFAIVETLHEKFLAAGWESRARRERGWLERRFRRGTTMVAGSYGPMPDIREDAAPAPNWKIDVEMRKASAEAFLVTAVLADDATT